MSRKLLILGAGGHGKVIADLAGQLDEWEVAGFLDDDPEKRHSRVLGIPVLGPIGRLVEIASAHGVTAVAAAFGDNKLRPKHFELAVQTGLERPRLIHPSAVISPHAELGAGTIVLAGVVVNADVVTGENVCLNTACRVDHDCRLGDHSHIFPGAVLTGGVQVGKGAAIGANAVVNPLIKVGDGALVGAGAVVTRDVPAREVVAGNPARPLPARELQALSRTGVPVEEPAITSEFGRAQ